MWHYLSRYIYSTDNTEYTGLLVNYRDQDVTVMKTNILGLCNMAKVLDLPSIITASLPA